MGKREFWAQSDQWGVALLGVDAERGTDMEFARYGITSETHRKASAARMPSITYAIKQGPRFSLSALGYSHAAYQFSAYSISMKMGSLPLLDFGETVSGGKRRGHASTATGTVFPLSLQFARRKVS